MTVRQPSITSSTTNFLERGNLLFEQNYFKEYDGFMVSGWKRRINLDILFQAFWQAVMNYLKWVKISGDINTHTHTHTLVTQENHAYSIVKTIGILLRN